MTVGGLRVALEEFPDDAPLRFAVPDREEDGIVDDAFEAIAAGYGSARYGDERGTVQDTFVTVDLEATGVDPRDELMNHAPPRPAAER